MNVLLFALGSHGDVHPFVGIGIRLRERGHHVAVAANGYFKELVDHAGLEFISIGTADEYLALATDPKLWDRFRGPQAVFAGTARYLRPMYEIARDFGKRPDAVIAASTLALGARIAQDKHRIRLASVHLSPAVFQSEVSPPMFPPFSFLPSATPQFVKRGLWYALNRFMDSVIGPSMNDLRRELGLPPVKHIIRDYWHSPQRVIGMFPQWFCAPQPEWPKQTVLTGFPLFDERDLSPITPELEAFLQAGDAPIAFTPGSAMWQARDFFDASAAACVKLGRRGLLLTRHRDHLPPMLPPNVIHVHYAPFSTLLPRCCAFVHHAGIGSSAQGLASGVPQLLTPFTHDQPDNSARLKRLGVGRIVMPSKYTPDRVARALRDLIESPQVAQDCREVASRFVGIDAIGKTCELIESLKLRSPRTI